MDPLRETTLRLGGKLYMFERRKAPLLPRSKFLWRLFWSFLASLSFIAISLAVGMWGYHHFEGMKWLDAFANASMILSGMGPLKTDLSDPGKYFAGFYALYSGIALLTTVGILLAPIAHRFLHHFHLDDQG